MTSKEQFGKQTRARVLATDVFDVSLAEAEEHLLHDLGGVAPLIGQIGIASALIHRCREEPEPSPAQRTVGGSELNQHVVAIAVVVDHGLEATKLALDALEPLDDVVAIFVLKVHDQIIPPGVINLQRASHLGMFVIQVKIGKRTCKYH